MIIAQTVYFNIYTLEHLKSGTQYLLTNTAFISYKVKNTNMLHLGVMY